MKCALKNKLVLARGEGNKGIPERGNDKSQDLGWKNKRHVKAQIIVQ